MNLSFTDSIPQRMNPESGIYCIKSHIPKYKNKVLYVGSSLHLGLRWTKHRSELRKDVHHNNYLQNYYNKYGESSLYFKIIEPLPFASIETLHERETYWIKEINPVMNLKSEVTLCGGIPQHWIVCSPEGEWSLVYNLTQFAALHNLTVSSLVSVAYCRNGNKSYKGWFIRLANYSEIQKGKVLNTEKSPRIIDTVPYLNVKGISTDKKMRFKVHKVGYHSCKSFNKTSLAIDYLKLCFIDIISQGFNVVGPKDLASSLASLSYHFLITEDSYSEAWKHCLFFIEDLVVKGYSGNKDDLINLTTSYLRKLVDNPKYKPYHNNIYGNLDTSLKFKQLPIETRIKEAIGYMKQIGATPSVINLSKASGINYQYLTREWSYYYKPLLNPD